MPTDAPSRKAELHARVEELLWRATKTGEAVVSLADMQAITALTREAEAQGGEDGVSLIAAERRQHVTREGWTPEHDAEHTDGALAQAAGCYALAHALVLQGHGKDNVPAPWPWDAEWWKPTPKEPVRQLVKAGALIAAEIDRLLAAATQREEG